MFCEKCGTELPNEARFCQKCGAQISPNILKMERTKLKTAGTTSYKKWIFGGIIGGVAIAAVVVGSLFAIGIFGNKKETVQLSTSGMSSDTGVSDVTEQPVATAVITPSPTLKPTVVPMESDEPKGTVEENVSDDYLDEEDVLDDFPEDGDGTVGRTPEETYKQYIESFVEAVNTGDTDELGQVMSGIIYKQQCDIVENYYGRGIQEELQSYSILSTKWVNDSCTKIKAKETIKVFYGDGSSKVVKQKYRYVCKYINSMWVITGMESVQK